MLKKAIRLALVALALVVALNAPIAPVVRADGAGAGSGIICPPH